MQMRDRITINLLHKINSFISRRLFSLMSCKGHVYSPGIGLKVIRCYERLTKICKIHRHLLHD